MLEIDQHTADALKPAERALERSATHTFPPASVSVVELSLRA